MDVQRQQPQIRDLEDDYRIDALAKVNKMRDDLINANLVISQLRADLARQQDRLALVFEERNRFRHESLRFRRLLTELTTQMANIGLLTRKAEEFVTIINEIDEAPAPSTETIDKLVAELPPPAPAVSLP